MINTLQWPTSRTSLLSKYFNNLPSRPLCYQHLSIICLPQVVVIKTFKWFAFHNLLLSIHFSELFSIDCCHEHTAMACLKLKTLHIIRNSMTCPLDLAQLSTHFSGLPSRHYCYQNASMTCLPDLAVINTFQWSVSQTLHSYQHISVSSRPCAAINTFQCPVSKTLLLSTRFNELSSKP